MSRPFRLQLHTPSSREQARWQKQFPGQAGQDVSTILDNIRAAGECEYEPTHDLKAWGQHPDERVARALLNRADAIRENYRDHQPALNEALLVCFQNASQRAHQENNSWTPVLDAFQHHLEWPHKRIRNEQLEGPVKLAQEQLQPLVGWIQQQDDPRKLEKILQFQSGLVHRALAREAPCIDPQLQEQLLERSGDLASSLALNDTLPVQQQEQLLQWALRQFHGGALAQVSNLSGAQGVLVGLQDLSVVQPHQLVDTLLEALEPHLESRHSMRAPAVIHALDVLLQTPEVPQQDLVRMGEAVQEYSSHIRMLLDHPRAGESLWQWALQKGGLSVRRVLAMHPEASRVKSIREQLSDDLGDLEVLEGLTRTARGEEFDRLFTRLRETSPQKAINLIEEIGADDSSPIRSYHLTELLGHTEGELRRRALRASQQFRRRKETESPVTPETGSVQHGR